MYSNSKSDDDTKKTFQNPNGALSESDYSFILVGQYAADTEHV
jgi:hypothetical protein